MRKILAGFSILSILALAVSPAWAVNQSRNPTPTPSDIEKITFVHYTKPDGHSKPVWDDTQEDFRLITGGVKWPKTISYEVNPTGSNLDPEGVKNAFEMSSETWDVKTGFELFAPPTITTDSSVGYDNTNRVIWETLEPGVIAVTYLWYNPAAKQIVEFDMVFNTYYLWSLTGESTKMDVQNIATHELGHNGLGDLRPPKDWALTMYAYSGLGEVDKQTLGIGDILGIQKLYGGI